MENHFFLSEIKNLNIFGVKFDSKSKLENKKESNFTLEQLVIVHYPSILTNFLGVTEH